MSMTKINLMFAIGITICFFLSCTSKKEAAWEGKNKNQTAPLSITLLPKSGSNVTGSLSFTQDGKILRISGLVSGLSSGLHGIHIHEKPDCSADDASSAGAHFAHPGQIHGRPAVKTSHLGDLGNIQAGRDGQVIVSLTSENLCLNSKKPCSIRGRSIVIHEQEDDFRSQPSGQSGARVACGVIP